MGYAALCKGGQGENMAKERVFEDEELESLRRKYFPRVPWTGAGPVRRRYLARAAEEGQTAEAALAKLAEAEGFTGPEEETVIGRPETCLAAFRARGGRPQMIFGQGTDALWCDAAVGPADGSGWQELIVRSEEAENLVALAHAVGALRFRKAT